MSFTPRNQAAARSVSSRNRGSPVTAKPRAHAAAVVPASTGCWSKPGLGSPGPQPPAGAKLKWPSSVSTPASQARSSTPSSTLAGRDQRVGEQRVVVGEPGLGPRPRRIRPGTREQRPHLLEQLLRPDLRRGERHPGIRARRRRFPDLRAAPEARECTIGDRMAGGGGNGEAEERAALGIVGARCVVPHASGPGRTAVAEPPVGPLSLLEVAEIHLCEPFEPNVPLRLAADDCQGASGVVGAVAVLEPRLAVQRVLEEPVLVGQCCEVGEAQAVRAAGRRTLRVSSA